MSSLAETDFEDLRVHFSEKKWKRLKEVEKKIYLNQKTNHLFKLSVGLTSKVPEFMRTAADTAREESDHPPPVKKVRKGYIKKDYHSAEFTTDRDLRIRTNVVNYKEPTSVEWEIVPLKPKKRKAVKKKKIKKRRKEKIYKGKVRHVLTETVLDRTLRNRTNVVNYTEVPEDDRATDQGTSAPQPSEDDEEWDESDDKESISSDSESDSESDSTDQETSAPQPSKKKKRGEKSEDEQSIPSDEESDATETAKVGSPRVTLLRLSVDRMQAKMHQETSVPQPSKEEEEESEDEQTIPSDEKSGNATETVKVGSPRVTLLALSVDQKAPMQLVARPKRQAKKHQCN